MDFKDCIEFANKTHLAWIATCEGDQPRVRPIGMWFADESGFYFQTHGGKDFHQQLLKNPQIEAAFYEPGKGLGTMMRVSGQVEFLEDLELKQKVMKDRAFLEGVGLNADHPELIVFRLSTGNAHFWNMNVDLQPKTIISF